MESKAILAAVVTCAVLLGANVVMLSSRGAHAEAQDKVLRVDEIEIAGGRIKIGLDDKGRPMIDIGEGRVLVGLTDDGIGFVNVAVTEPGGGISVGSETTLFPGVVKVAAEEPNTIGVFTSANGAAITLLRGNAPPVVLTVGTGDEDGPPVLKVTHAIIHETLLVADSILLVADDGNGNGVIVVKGSEENDRTDIRGGFLTNKVVYSQFLEKLPGDP